MSEEKKIITGQADGNNSENVIKDTGKEAAQAVAASVYGKARGKKRRDPRRGKSDKSEEDFEQRIIDIARVTRVMAGGKRMRFRACVAVGNKKGKVAIGLAKGADVSIAVQKAVNKAKKKYINVFIVNDTIPYGIYHKKGAAKILLKPARKGRGVIAGGAVRIILELAGIKNITSKILGTNNKVNNVKCVIEALNKLRRIESKKKYNKNNNKDNETENEKLKNQK